MMNNDKLHAAACAALPSCIEEMLKRINEDTPPNEAMGLLEIYTTLAVTFAVKINAKLDKNGETL